VSTIAPTAPKAAVIDALDAYRRMFAGAEDGLSAWWYLGNMRVEMENFPAIPVLHVETVMVYRTTTLSPDSFRMDWWEIGYMRDPVTGEIAKSWTNPITGKVVPAPQKFEEGPARFIISRADNGIKLELIQAHARVQSVEAVFTESEGRILLVQTEKKVRGFPLPNGEMPSLDSDGVSPALTRLNLFSSRADLTGAYPASSGSYDFELAPPPWMGFGDMKGRSITQGVMVKTPMQERINPTGWARLQALFPEHFDGENIVPKWA
jgi:hypothetical protein